MYRTFVTIEVLSEEPIHPDMDLADIAREADLGAFVAGPMRIETIEISRREMAESLTRLGSEPGFFRLNADGNPEDYE